VDQGNLPEAPKSYRDGLAIIDRLAKSDPGSAGWQRDLSVSYDKTAVAFMKAASRQKRLTPCGHGCAGRGGCVWRHNAGRGS
jgi:hypothetical protein